MDELLGETIASVESSPYGDRIKLTTESGRTFIIHPGRNFIHNDNWATIQISEVLED